MPLGGRWIEGGGLRANMLPYEEETVEITGAAEEELVVLVPNCGAGVPQKRGARALALVGLAKVMRGHRHDGEGSWCAAVKGDHLRVWVLGCAIRCDVASCRERLGFHSREPKLQECNSNAAEPCVE